MIKKQYKETQTMRKKGILLTAVLAGSIFATATYAETAEEGIANSTRSIAEKVDKQDGETFFYNKGFSDGFEEGKKIGFEQALKEGAEALSKYEAYIKSLEAGKYLSKKGKITPPRIYQEKRADGSISVVVQGCNIEGELSPKDILLFPSIDESRNNSSRKIASSSAGNSDSVSDSVYLAGIDNPKKQRPLASNSAINATFRTFEDNSFYRKLFRGSGLAFSIQPNREIRVMFSSEQEAERFMNRHGLTSGKDYR